MSIKEYQTILAKLYTDPYFRNIFFESEEYNSHPLKALKRDEVDFFAQGLINKRLGVVKGLMPLSYHFLGSQFNDLFQSYSKKNITNGGVQKHYLDAITFSYFLNEQKSLPFIWLKDLIRYEGMKIESFLINNRFVTKRFNYPVHKLTTDLKANERITKRTTVLIFVRFKKKVKWLKIN